MGRVDDVSIYGVLGYPLSQSLSPALHNAVIQGLKVRAVYARFETLDPIWAIRGARALGIRGLSVTIPYKEKVFHCLDGWDGWAARIGAINTILNKGNALIGHNTDGPGAMAAIKEVLDPKGIRCLIVGAGGAARAIALCLKGTAGRIFVTNRDPKRGQILSEQAGGEFIPLERISGLKVDLIVQATSLGMYPSIGQWPFDPEMVEGPLVMEAIYNPLKTRFLEKALHMGRRVIPGYKMFLFQAAMQVELFYGAEPPMAFMEEVVLRELMAHEKDKKEVKG